MGAGRYWARAFAPGGRGWAGGRRIPKATSARGFQGNVNESHRLFVVSFDLLHQGGREPWLEPVPLPEDLSQVLLDFVLSNRDAFDVNLAFDGTLRKSRRYIEDAFSACAGVAEFMVVYDAAPSATFLRKNFMSQRNVEVGHVRMPISRSKVSVKSRAEGFGASGETSSTYTSYSGVKAIPRTHLSRISVEDKMKIFPEATGPLPRRYSSAVSESPGVPLFWHETKSVQFWGQLLDDLHVKCVVDVSPGSGLLAQTCMSKGIQYFGMCMSSCHLTWLSNVLDRACLKYVVESGSYLYQEDLGALIKELFSDVLLSLEKTEEDVVVASDEEDR